MHVCDMLVTYLRGCNKFIENLSVSISDSH